MPSVLFGSELATTTFLNVADEFLNAARLYTTPPSDDADLTTGTEANFGSYSAKTDCQTNFQVYITPDKKQLEFQVSPSIFQSSGAPSNNVVVGDYVGFSADRPSTDPQVVLMEWQEAKTIGTLDYYRMAVKVKVRCV